MECTKDKMGRPVPLLPRVIVGHERLNRNGPSRLSGTSVVCNLHGTRPACRVNNRGVLVICCRSCIMENCEIVRAILRPNWDETRGALDHAGPY